MTEEIIVTDLTRFKKDGQVCLAGYGLNSHLIIRPMPYLTQEECKQYSILPGTKLGSNFTRQPNAAPPHIEDHWHAEWCNYGNVSSLDFLNVLEETTYPSVAIGFGVVLPAKQKFIAPAQNPTRSLITIEVNPANIEIVPGYNDSSTLKVNLCDAAHQEFWYLPLTDLGFFRYAQAHSAKNQLFWLNGFIRSQQRVLLRIGLGRYYENPHSQDKGYWIQVNGIHTFPDYPKEIRSYE